MRRCTALLLVMSLSLMPASGLAFSRTASSDNHHVSSASAHTESRSLNESEIKRRALESFGQLPLRFEVNQGQSDGSVRFFARGRGYSLFLTDTEAVLGLKKSSQDSADKSAVVGMQPVNGSPHPQVIGLNQLPGITNYLLGNDPSQWRTNVKSYEKVEYRNIWPGVNQVYYGNQGELEYDFIVAPGISPNIIRVTFPGADSLRIDQSGELVLSVCGNEIRQHAPVIYQQRNGKREIISGRYALYTNNGRQEVGFEIGRYDTSRTLVIDPVLIYSTYFGGSAADTAESITVDSAGNMYVSGVTNSSNLPTAGPFRSGYSGAADSYICKLNSLGNSLIFSTYIGGTGNDVVRRLAVDAAGNCYITGFTSSGNYPTQNPLQGAFGGGDSDAFITKLNAAGNGLVYSSYLGGSGADSGIGLAVDTGNSPIISGETTSANFPTSSAAQATNQGQTEAFVTKYRNDGAAYTYSTYLGGVERDSSASLAIDSTGAVYIAGYTFSSNFPIRGSAFQDTYGGLQDAFVAKFSTAGAIVYSTFLGGSANEEAYGISVDSAGSAYITGYTFSPNFPVVSPVQGTIKPGTQDAFVTKLSASGASIVYSTYLGGASGDYGNSVVVDSAGSASVVGTTYSNDFPVTSVVVGQGGQIIPPGSGGETLVFKLNTTGNALIFASTLGGSGVDFGVGIALDTTGNLYICGQTNSTTFPVVGAYQSNNAGNSDAFVTKIDPTRNTAYFTAVSAASYSVNGIAPEGIVAGFGANLAGRLEQGTTIPLPTRLADREVRVKDVNGNEQKAPLFIVVGGLGGQINFQIPATIAAGRALITVVDAVSNLPIAAGYATIGRTGPGIFTANASGTGTAAAYVIRVRSNGQQSFEPIVSGTTSIPINLGPPGETVYLVLFGTSIGKEIRDLPPAQSTRPASIDFGGLFSPLDPAKFEFAGSVSSFVGLDQYNAILPRALAGRGEVNVNVVISGYSEPQAVSNIVKIQVQ
jgi:uncharacterized protein (TIGR03437 family)